VRILLSIFLYKCAQVFTICTNKDWSIVISSLKISSSKTETSSKFAISGGVFSLTICSKGIHFVEHLSIWLLKWFRIKITIILWIYGHLVSYFMSLCMEEHLSQEFIQGKLVIKLWEGRSDLSQACQMNTRIWSIKF